MCIEPTSPDKYHSHRTPCSKDCPRANQNYLNNKSRKLTRNCWIWLFFSVGMALLQLSLPKSFLKFCSHSMAASQDSRLRKLSRWLDRFSGWSASCWKRRNNYASNWPAILPSPSTKPSLLFCCPTTSTSPGSRCTGIFQKTWLKKASNPSWRDCACPCKLS